MKKKHIIIGLSILLTFAAILFLQIGGEGMKNSIASTMMKGLKGLFVNHSSIPLNDLSAALSASQCKLQKKEKRYTLQVQQGQNCTVRIPREKEVITRKLPLFTYQSGHCYIELRHFNNPYLEKPEQYNLPEDDKKTVTLSVFENGARLTIQAHNSNHCMLTIAEDN